MIASANRGRKMSNEPPLLHGVTEARGSYNRNAASQAAGGATALPFLDKAAREVRLDRDQRPIVIADYGSSQGKNSLEPMRRAIAALRKRLPPRRPICVVHTDVAENDFSTLFDVLESARESYLSNDPDVFPSAVGRSFYRPVLPPGHVDLGWSSYAAVWLSHAPIPLPDHIWIQAASGEVRAAFVRQAAEDWETFLRLRARELRAGGRLVVVLPGAPEEGLAPVHRGMDLINAELAQMVAENAIAAEERARMILLSYTRRTSEILAPFAGNRQFEGLSVQQWEAFPVSDPAWAAYEQDHDKERLAAKHTAFFRSTFMPSLASGLAPERGAEERQAFVDRLARALQRRLAEEPAPIHLIAQALLIAKEEEG
jgi:hypothetical protein